MKTNSCLSVSSPFLELYCRSSNKHSAALPSSQSIMEIFIFWLHCGLHSARKIQSDRSSSLLTPPFFLPVGLVLFAPKTQGMCEDISMLQQGERSLSFTKESLRTTLAVCIQMKSIMKDILFTYMYAYIYFCCQVCNGTRSDCS